MINLGLSIDELEIFVAAARLSSLKETCRQLSLQPARVTRTVQGLERKVGAKLFTRSVQGVRTTPEGTRLLRVCEKIMELVPELDLRKLEPAGRRESETLYTIASLSFLCSRLVAPKLGAWRIRRPGNRFRLLEFTDNDELVSRGLKGAFDVAIHIGPLPWTRAWTSKSLGSLRWSLFGRSGHPLGPVCTEEKALRYPFIVPTGWTENGFVTGEDHCPLSVDRRIAGNEATTAETALEMIQSTDELTFVPQIMAAQGGRAIQEIQVREWAPVSREIFISAHSARVPAPLLALLRGGLRQD